MSAGADFWEDPERVEDFASRSPDRRLLELLDGYADPGSVRVLDLGCAGGRNTIVLAERGFDFQAMDASRAMVEKTRERVESVLGTQEARRRVHLGRMEDLDRFESEFFDLAVALGIYHSADSEGEWDRAIEETVRVLVPAGWVLVSSFSPRSDPNGEGLRPVPGSPHMYAGLESGPLFLLEAEDLDAGMLRHGLIPVVRTETVTVPTELGHRVTVNALYEKQELIDRSDIEMLSVDDIRAVSETPSWERDPDGTSREAAYRLIAGAVDGTKRR